MALELKKPICFFDLETTGTNIVKDRIVEIAILKVFPNGNRQQFTWLVNPEIEIPAEVVAVHGISNEKVVNEPTFKALSKTIYELIKDSDLSGFNRLLYHLANAPCVLATWEETLSKKVSSLEEQGIDPCASCMQSRRSTI